MNTNRHFDCLKNKLPENWTNKNASGYYNRAFWKRCKCEYGPHNPCKETADKWNPSASESSKWTKGCSPCSDFYDRPSNYFYSYNIEDCGNCGKCNNKCDPCNKCCKPCCDPCDPCDKCCKQCSSSCTDDCRKCKPCLQCCQPCQPHNPCGNCDKCKHHKHKHPFKTFITNDRCSDCTDVAIVYRMVNDEKDCDNIVELKVPLGGTKEQYLAKHFSPEFIYANRFQCATMPVYASDLNNVIDNRREEEFTISDQGALTKRGINNALFAQKLIDEGKLIHERYGYQIPMNVCGRTCYSYFGDCFRSGSNITGLAPEDITKFYFRNDN